MKRELQYEVTEEEDGLRLDQYIAGRCMDLSPILHTETDQRK